MIGLGSSVSRSEGGPGGGVGGPGGHGGGFSDKTLLLLRASYINDLHVVCVHI